MANDGFWGSWILPGAPLLPGILPLPVGGSAGGPGPDLLAIRHDRGRTGRIGPRGAPDEDKRGNAAFIDGHAEYIERGRSREEKYANPYVD